MDPFVSHNDNKKDPWIFHDEGKFIVTMFCVMYLRGSGPGV